MKGVRDFCHKNSLVRNRAGSILAANARWDAENRYDSLLDEFLAHVTDEKPITSRQCIQAFRGLRLRSQA